MKRLVLTLFVAGTSLLGQATPAAPAVAGDDPVVVVIEGKEWKKSELEAMVRAMGGNITSNFLKDKRNFLHTFALMTKLSKMAEADGMDKEQPHNWRLFYNRMLYLAQARADAQPTREPIMPADQQTYYNEHKADFSSARVKVLFLNFNDAPPAGASATAKKPRTSAEAEKLAAEIVKQARAGKDFTELVKQYSDDTESKAKGGDFPPIKPNDNSLPAQLKSAIFALKAGQVSDGVRQAAGFWIFRMEEFVTPPYDEVKDDIFRAIQEGQFRTWMETVRKEVKVEFKDDKYLDDKTPAVLPPAAK